MQKNYYWNRIIYVLVLLDLFFLQSIYYLDNFKKAKKEELYNFHTNSFPGHRETSSSFEESSIIYCT